MNLLQRVVSRSAARQHSAAFVQGARPSDPDKCLVSRRVARCRGLGLHVSNLRRNVVVRPRSCWTRSGASFLSTTRLGFPLCVSNITPARRDHEVGPT